VRRLGTRIGPRAGRRLGSFLIDDDDPTAQHDDDDEQQDEQVEKLWSWDVDRLLAGPDATLVTIGAGRFRRAVASLPLGVVPGVILHASPT